jgi:hypothetical protein
MVEDLVVGHFPDLHQVLRQAVQIPDLHQVRPGVQIQAVHRKAAQNLVLAHHREAVRMGEN